MKSIIATGAIVLAGLGLAACGPNATADTRSFSEVMTEEGLAGVEAWSAAQPESAEVAFLSGMSSALSAIEHVLQVRWANYSGELPLTPGGQVEVGPNPDAVFDPAFVEIAMAGALTHLESAEAALESATGEAFAIEVDLADIWFDIDANGERNEGESALQQIGFMLGQDVTAEDFPDDTTIRFDTADADWLAAYVQLTSGTAELILSLDPTSAIKAVFDGNEAMTALGTTRPDPIFGTRNQLDTLAVVLTMLDGVPDATRTRAALADFKAMIVHNQDFWQLVVDETDNDREWLPNADQVSAFGVEVSAEAAESWQGVLAEAADVLNGRKLVPHWRVSGDEGSAVGVNIESLLTNPGDFDLVLLLHGASLAPHMQEGELADMRSWAEFSRAVGGNEFLFAAWMN